MVVGVRRRPLPPSAYKAYMESQEWAETRARWKDRRRRRRFCWVCRDHRYHLHHRTYLRLGCEWARDLVPLCDRHHEAVHRLERALGALTGSRDAAIRWATRLYLLFRSRRGWLTLAVLACVALLAS